MTDVKTQLSYSVLRYVHDLETEEFVNVGIITFDKRDRKILVQMEPGVVRRVKALFSEVDTRRLQSQLRDVAERARDVAAKFGGDLYGDASLEGAMELVAPQGPASLQWCGVRTCLVRDPAQRAQTLFEDFVLRYFIQASDRPRMRDQDLAKKVVTEMHRAGLEGIRGETLRGATDFFFQWAWQNGQRQVANAIALDIQDERFLMNKAERWRGRLEALAEDNDFSFTALVRPPRSVHEERAIALIEGASICREITNDPAQLVAMIQSDTRSAQADAADGRDGN